MMKSDWKCQTDGLMTRKLLLTAAIVALTLAPSIGAGTAQARGFYGGGSVHRSPTFKLSKEYDEWIGA
jgi:hypothetical protein